MSAINVPSKIEIRPIPNRAGIRDFSSNLEFFAQPHVIAPFVDPVTHKYVTGLSEEDIKYLKELGCGYNLDSTHMRGVPHEFWESSLVKMELQSSPTFLYPKANMIDFIKYKYLMASNYIYSSEEEMNETAKSEATHYIYSEEQELSIKAAEIEQRNALTMKLSKLSLKKKREFILILLDEVVENKDDNYITVAFERIITDKDLAFELSALLDRTNEDITLSAEIKTAIHKNVLKPTSQGIFFFDTPLGFSEDEVRENLQKPENQEILLSIKSKI